MVKKTKGMKIESELVKLTGLKRKSREDTGEWISRLVKASLVVDDDELDGMTDTAYAYCTSVADALESGKGFLDFDQNALSTGEEEEEDEEEEIEEAEDELEEEETEEEDEEDETEEAEEEEETEAQVEAEEESPKPKKRKRAQKRSPVSGELTSKTEAYREFLLISDWTRPRAVLIEEGLAAGFGPNPNSVSGVIYHTKNTLAMMESLLGVTLPDPSKRSGEKTVARAVKKSAKHAAKAKATKKVTKKVARKKAVKVKEQAKVTKKVGSRRRRAVGA